MPTRTSVKRDRQTKIVATLGPASAEIEIIRKLFVAGVDVFRLNFSHGRQDDHAERLKAIRDLEGEFGRPIAVMADLQGPKLRIGTFADGPVDLEPGQSFRLDMDDTPGDKKRVRLPHPEVFRALSGGQHLLLDDGKVRLRVEACGRDFAETTVVS